MDYRIVSQPGQRFIALVRSFPNEIVSDDSNHSIPDFWDECRQNQLIEPLRQLRPAGKRDLYGLCTPKQERSDSFCYGIGVMLDDDFDTSKLDHFLQQEYQIWETASADYAVFRCIGADAGSISRAWRCFYSEFLTGSGYRHADLTDYEIYFETGPAELFCELWIPIEKTTN